MKKFLRLLLAIVALDANAQEKVVWGSEVTDVSSEYSYPQYGALQALHKPNVLPNGGDNPNAWRPKRESGEAFIMVSFDDAIQAKQIAIAESENPGAVSKVYGYDEAYNEYLLFELTPRTIPLKSRLLNLFFEETAYKVKAVKVYMNADVVPGFNAIDAIGVSSSNIPINVLINLVPGVAADMHADAVKEVNSSAIEHSPVISPDGTRLYFSRRYHPDNVGGIDDMEDIWVSDLDSVTGKWLPARNLGPPLNTPGPNFISSISILNGREVFVLGNKYEKKGKMKPGVSVSRRVGQNAYEMPRSIDIENDYNYSPKVDYFLSPSGKAMIISEERDDGYGGRDLYVSFYGANHWSEPKNLGPSINTASDDYSPFLAQDEKTLYYSTSGYSAYGGADIFVSFRQDESWVNWSEPENLGSSLNSPNDDQYFSIPSSGRHIYFSRGVVDEDTDIFKFKADDIFIDRKGKLIPSVGHLIGEDEEPPGKFITIRGSVLEELSGDPISEATIYVERLPDGIEIGKALAGADGSYELTVRPGARYGFLAEKAGFISTGENLDLNSIDKSDTIDVYLNMTRIEAGTSFIAKSVHFKFNTTDLTTSSYPELNRILDVFASGKIKRIEVSGHTDSVGDDDYNQQLSALRAKVIVDFFHSNGISYDRMEFKGYGESRPLVSNDTPENRAKNRRVEIKIIE